MLGSASGSHQALGLAIITCTSALDLLFHPHRVGIVTESQKSTIVLLGVVSQTPSGGLRESALSVVRLGPPREVACWVFFKKLEAIQKNYYKDPGEIQAPETKAFS